MSKKLPIVAIVGRANVGKSSLFNAILDRREAIVANEPGTTRDSIMAKASAWTGPRAAGLDAAQGSKEKRRNRTNGTVTEPRTQSDAAMRQESLRVAGSAGQQEEAASSSRYDFWLVDTAGMKNPEDDFEFTIQEQIEQAADSADIIWVMVEANVMITDVDRKVAKMALKSKKPVFLVVNKIDKARKLDIMSFQKLGIKDIIGTSATHLEGVNRLLSELVKIIPQVSQTEDDNRLRIALLGRPNVGKSALFNTLASKQQAIVADRAGTTRDINRAVVRYQGREVEIMDTAGIRRSGKIGKGIEHFSVIRTLSAIEQADICFLLMDANELNVQLDQKIAGMIKEAGKGLVLVVSKWDSLDKDAYTRDNLAPQIANTYDFVPWAPLIFTSAVSGQNVTKLFDLAFDIDAQRAKKLTTRELNNWLREVVGSHPPAGLKNRSPKLNYIVQEDDNPTPAFKVFGSHTKFIHWSYRRYMERNLRERYGYAGTPIQFWFIEKHITHKHGSSPTRGDARPPRKIKK